MKYFAIRVLLHRAGSTDYAALAQRLRTIGVVDVIRGEDGTWYRLPPGEYNYEGDATSAQAGLGTSFMVDGECAATVLPEVRAVFEAIAREFAGASPGRVQCLQAQDTLLAVACLRVRGDALPGPRANGARDALVQRYRALLETHYREHRPLGFYADALAVTADHLSRTCRQVAGASALDLLHDRLMLEARRLLTYTPLSVAQVAVQLGYDDAAYFSKFFARCVGRSPSAYRDGVARGVQAPAT